MAVNVTLTWTEVRVAGLTGIDRNIRTIHENRHRGGGQHPADGWTDHITGALAECAVAKALDLYPSRKERDTDGDVGRYQVRSTVRHESLIVQEYDDDRDVFILVLGSPPVLTLEGWIAGIGAKQPRFWRTDVRRPAYFVPRHELHSMEDLP